MKFLRFSLRLSFPLALMITASFAVLPSLAHAQGEMSDEAFVQERAGMEKVAETEMCASMLKLFQSQKLDAMLVVRSKTLSPSTWMMNFMSVEQQFQPDVQKLCPTSAPERFFIQFAMPNAGALLIRLVQRMQQTQGAHPSFPTTGTVQSYLAGK